MSATAVLSGPNRTDPPTLASDSSNKYFMVAAVPLESSSRKKKKKKKVFFSGLLEQSVGFHYIHKLCSRRRYSCVF